MAFVYEVERPPLFDTKKATSEIGPGQYLPLTFYKFEKPNAVPFLASSNHGELFKSNQFPGPGAYNSKENQNVWNKTNKNLNSDTYSKKNINKSIQKTKNNVEIVNKKLYDINEPQNKGNNCFFTKVERFKEKANKEDTPGPGTYGDNNILLAKSIEEKCYKKKDLIYKINNERLKVYSVNRFDRQFPWNSEIIDLNNNKDKKKKKNKSLDASKKIKFSKFMKPDNNNSITISKLSKEKVIKRDDINKYEGNKLKIFKDKQKNDNSSKYKDNNLFNLKISLEKRFGNSNSKFDSEEQNKKRFKVNNNKLPIYKKISTLKKSKTSINFFAKENKISKNLKHLSKKEIKEKLNKELKLSQTPNDMKYRISSIPSKFCVGYEIEKSSGKIARRPIKTYFKIFSGENSDTVGPGSYDLNLAEDWRKTGTSWSKYLVKKESFNNRPSSGSTHSSDNKNIINYNKLDKQFKKIVKNPNIKVSNQKYNLNVPNLYKFYSTQHIFFHPKTYNIKKINSDIIKDKLPIFIPVNDVPGPGYYYDEEIDKQSIKTGKNDFTKLKNAHLYDEDIQVENNEDEGELGPGSYFNDIFNLNDNKTIKNKKDILSGKKPKNVPFLCSAKRFSYEMPNMNQNLTNKEGQIPDIFRKMVLNNDVSWESTNSSKSTYKYKFSLGEQKFFEGENVSMSKTYNSKINKLNKFRPLNGTFYRRDIRFREMLQEEKRKKEIPGPGSYINPFTNTGKTNSIKMDGKYMDIRSCRVWIEKNMANKIKENKKLHKNLSFLGEWGMGHGLTPGVGTYEPEKTFTILYDINKNKKYGTSHFNSTQFSDRNGFYLFQKNSPNGPGSYYQDKLVDKKQNSAAFNSTADRFLKGGKNNTKNLYELPKKMIDATMKKNKEGETELGLTEKTFKETNIQQKNILNNSSTPNIIGPGSYNFLPEVYPWVKQSYNSKFI